MTKTILVTLMLFMFSQNEVKSQMMVEVCYTKPFLDAKNLGSISSANIFDFRIGLAGGGGCKINGVVNVGYIGINDNLDIGEENKLKYKSLFVGGKLGMRPFADIWVSRFQPIIQVSAKRTFKVEIKVDGSDEIEQLFSNGNTKQYDPAKITFLTSSLGFEYFLGQRFSLNVLAHYDYVIINQNKFNNYSTSLGLRLYY
jgi:hypothetical protein